MGPVLDQNLQFAKISKILSCLKSGSFVTKAITLSEDFKFGYGTFWLFNAVV